MKRKRTDGPVRWIFDLLFGHDYFIAHRSRDGKQFATALYDRLSERGNELECFLDTKHYGAGGSLSQMQERALRKATRLIVIVTPGAHDEEAYYVREEIADFRRMHPDGVIVPIGSIATLSMTDPARRPLLGLVPHLPDGLCILEPEDVLTGPDARPSPQTIAKLLNDFSEERRSSVRTRWISRVAAALFVLLVAAVGFAVYAATQRRIAITQRGVAEERLRIALENNHYTVNLLTELGGFVAPVLEMAPNPGNVEELSVPVQPGLAYWILVVGTDSVDFEASVTVETEDGQQVATFRRRGGLLFYAYEPDYTGMANIVVTLLKASQRTPIEVYVARRVAEKKQ